MTIRRATNPDVAPFAVDSWPWRDPWAGVYTFADQLEVEEWARRAQLQLQLEVDRRFDALADRLQLELERRRPAVD